MYKYLGGGFMVGIPARNLSDEEAKQFGLDKIKKSGLYKQVRTKTKIEVPEIEERGNPAAIAREKESE